MPTPAIERIKAALVAEAGDASGTRPGQSPIAVGWATVELDRAATELAAELGLPPLAFAPATSSEVLGARCRVAAGALPGGVSLAILEPETEGRIAATLARLGEGPAVAWLPLDGDVAGTSAARPGPFGAERLVLGSPVFGPHRLLVTTGPGTIRA